MSSGLKISALLSATLLFCCLQQAAPVLASPQPSSSNSDRQAPLPSSSPLPCSVEKPIVWPGDTVSVRIWGPPNRRAAQYSWTTTGGRITAQESGQASWDFTGTDPGYYTATVHYKDSSGSHASCSVQVVVEEHTGGRGTERDTSHDLLVKDTQEADGFGLYSYLFLSVPPDDSSRERYLKVIDAILQNTIPFASLEKYFDRRQLNITYIPVDASPPPAASSQWILQHYDYPRAHFLMRSLPGSHLKGPYIVSSLRSLSSAPISSGHYLFQDLSSVPSHLIPMWVDEFRNQSAQEHFWEESTSKKLVLNLRTTIGILAAGLPDVRKGLDDWISWTH